MNCYIMCAEKREMVEGGSGGRRKGITQMLSEGGGGYIIQ